MRSGSLFSGAAGLDLAVAEVLNVEPAWFVENDAAAAKVLAHHYPGTPNYGDITSVDWTTVEPVGLLDAGWPCQPWSQAGKRKGIEDERALWPEVARALRVLRPRYVVLENVPGIITAGELQRVADTLAALGYEFAWTVLGANEVGASHRRNRIFILGALRAAPNPAGDGWDEGRSESAGFVGGSDAAVGGSATAADTDSEHRLERRLPAPGQTPGWRSQCELAGRGRTGPVADAHSAGLEGPEPAPGRDLSGGSAAADTDGGRRGASEPDDDAGQPDTAGSGLEWGPYGPAIAWWEHILGRPAPAPTVRGARGGRKLNPALPEWMMGFPEGWIAAVPGVSVNEALKLAGNAVCPQQAAAALRWLFPLINEECAA